MVKAWFLVVVMFINGQWVPGEQFDGWAAMQVGEGVAGQVECDRKKERANGIQRDLEHRGLLATPKHFDCEEREVQ